MHCLNCGRELVERGCKVRCSYCGYFEDCSDPSAPGDWLSEKSDGRPSVSERPAADVPES